MVRDIVKRLYLWQDTDVKIEIKVSAEKLHLIEISTWVYYIYSNF